MTAEKPRPKAPGGDTPRGPSPGATFLMSRRRRRRPVDAAGAGLRHRRRAERAVDAHHGCALKRTSSAPPSRRSSPRADHASWRGDGSRRELSMPSLRLALAELLVRMHTSIGLERDCAYMIKVIYWASAGQPEPEPSEIELVPAFHRSLCRVGRSDDAGLLRQLRGGDLARQIGGRDEVAGPPVRLLRAGTSRVRSPRCRPITAAADPDFTKGKPGKDLLAIQKPLWSIS